MLFLGSEARVRGSKANNFTIGSRMLRFAILQGGFAFSIRDHGPQDDGGGKYRGCYFSFVSYGYDVFQGRLLA